MPLVKAVSVRIGVTGGDDAQVQIGRVRAKAAELAALDPTIKVKVDTAAARLEMDLFRAGLRADLAKAAAGDAGGGGGGGLFSVIRALFGGKVPAGSGGALGVAGKLAGITVPLGPLGSASLPIVAGVAAVLPALGSIVGGTLGIIPLLAAATAGVGAFGALALPTFSAVSGAVTKIATDTAAYHAATTAAAKSTALAKIKADWAALTPGQREAVRGVQGLQAEFGKLSEKIAPLALKIGGVALQIANKLLPALLPFAKTAGNAILGLVRNFDQFASSPGFKSFLSEFQRLAGPAITVIGEGIGKVAIALGKLLLNLVNPRALGFLAAFFAGLAGGIRILGDLLGWITRFGEVAIPGLLHGLAGFLHGLEGFVNQSLDFFGQFVHGAARAFGWIPGIGPQLKDASKSFDSFKASVDRNFNSARQTLNQWATSFEKAPKIFRLQGNIADLQAKLATARALLADKNLTATRRARVEANIDQLQRAIAAARAALNALQGKTVTTYINTIPLGTQSPHGPSPVGGATGATAPAAVHASAFRVPVTVVHNHISMPVTVAPGTHPAEVGRQVAEALKPYIKAGGRLYPAGVTPR